MLSFFERWRKELASRFISFGKRIHIIKPAKTLCTVTFLYTVKGIATFGKEQKQTVFAFIEDGVMTNELVPPLFNPPNSDKAQCKIHDVIVLPITTVKCKV